MNATCRVKVTLDRCVGLGTECLSTGQNPSSLYRLSTGPYRVVSLGVSLANSIPTRLVFLDILYIVHSYTFVYSSLGSFVYPYSLTGVILHREFMNK